MQMKIVKAENMEGLENYTVQVVDFRNFLT